MAGKLALSVSQLNEYVKRLLQLDPLLREIEIKGEISNFKLHQTGTLFFTLKDEQAAVSCVMYADEAETLEIQPFDGMRAVVTGSVGLYTRGGQYQFYAKHIRVQGIGVLFERYQMLRNRLEREGLFSAERKKPIPSYIDTMGVVSSPTGAVIHDIMNVTFRRDEHARILLCPVRVQGPDAADEVIAAIRMLETMDSVSVIVLARGGGSIEDLWTFNEERVVRAVAACTKPIVSAIGHETDFTLCDFAADLRAPTPSAAAECVVPMRSMLVNQVHQLKIEIQRITAERLKQEETRLELRRAQIAAFHPAVRVKGEEDRLTRLKFQMHQIVYDRIARSKSLLDAKRSELRLLSPYGVLSRGYALVMQNGRIVTDAKDVMDDVPIDVLMHGGEVRASVVGVKATECPKERK